MADSETYIDTLDKTLSRLPDTAYYSKQELSILRDKIIEYDILFQRKESRNKSRKNYTNLSDDINDFFGYKNDEFLTPNYVCGIYNCVVENNRVIRKVEAVRYFLDWHLMSKKNADRAINKSELLEFNKLVFAKKKMMMGSPSNLEEEDEEKLKADFDFKNVLYEGFEKLIVDSTVHLTILHKSIEITFDEEHIDVYISLHTPRTTEYDEYGAHIKLRIKNFKGRLDNIAVIVGEVQRLYDHKKSKENQAAKVLAELRYTSVFSYVLEKFNNQIDPRRVLEMEYNNKVFTFFVLHPFSYQIV